MPSSVRKRLPTIRGGPVRPLLNGLCLSHRYSINLMYCRILVSPHVMQINPRWFLQTIDRRGGGLGGDTTYITSPLEDTRCKKRHSSSGTRGNWIFNWTRNWKAHFLRAIR